MRRGAVLTVLFSLLTLLLTGCQQETPSADPVGSGFTCQIQADYKELDVKGTLERQGAGMLKLTFSAPESLAGMSALWDGESVHLELSGMSFSVDPATVPESALGAEITAVLDAAIRGEGERTQEGDKLIVRGSGNNGAYELVCDAYTGAPLSLSVPALPLSVTFSNFRETK